MYCTTLTAAVTFYHSMFLRDSSNPRQVFYVCSVELKRFYRREIICRGKRVAEICRTPSEFPRFITPLIIETEAPPTRKLLSLSLYVKFTPKVTFVRHIEFYSRLITRWRILDTSPVLVARITPHLDHNHILGLDILTEHSQLCLGQSEFVANVLLHEKASHTESTY